jgi:mono/diheme cytochrome c family protein
MFCSSAFNSFTPVRVALIGLTLTASLFVFAGCAKKDATPDASGGTGSGVSAAAGQTVFTTNCARCHAINGAGGGRAPDLSHVGADATHTAQWLAEYIKDPKRKDPGSRMPPFGGKISDSDIQAASAYLAGLK